MAKKTAAKKTTSKTSGAKAQRTATPKADRGTPPVKRSDVPGKEATDRGAPIEHYHGEPNRGKKTGDPGSLDEETLDRDAPYNKTYGRLRDEHVADS
jgi:hypothetical protein